MFKKMEISLESPVEEIPFTGKKLAHKLRLKGILTVGDLLYFLPRKYLDHSKIVSIGTLKPGETATCIGTLRSLQARLSGSLKITEAIIFDATGYLYLIWFGDRKLEKFLEEGTTLAVSGRATYYRGRLQMENPEFEIIAEHEKKVLLNTGRIVPVYPAVSGVDTRKLRKIIFNALETSYIPEILPAEIIIEEKLLPRQIALQELHFPSSMELVEKALYRLRFEELFLLQVALADLKKRYQSPELGIAHRGKEEVINTFFAQTGLKLTSSQERAIREIINDLKRPEPMNRLLQGEVGSGKTIVALAAAVYVASGGHQAAFMAPTEILAEQQYLRFESELRKLGLNPSLLTGSIKGKKKSNILELIASGKTEIVFGTHSLIYDDVEFKNLGLVIIDEQHRFGTMQRLLLREKGNFPDLLIISATPIPRTLALTVFGDLDVTTLKERPTGHSLSEQIKTIHLETRKRHLAYEHLQKIVSSGQQAFVIVPLIDENPSLAARHLKEAFFFLKRFVPEDTVRVLHGKLKTEEKRKAIEDFRSGKARVLLATTVIEVGIDVPQATLMIIENAERFGLAQLHQLRGRVGRGKTSAYVYAISDLLTEEAARRIDIFIRVYDGLQLAEEDLKLRGEGELLGLRQSGPSGFKFAQYARDIELLEHVRNLGFSYYHRYQNHSLSVKIILEEASKKFKNIELALKA